MKTITQHSSLTRHVLITCRQLVHQMLALYGTGATTEDIQRGYDHNKSYQLKRNEQGEKAQNALREDYDEAAKEFYGRGRYYGDFLRFYQGEIEKHGWQETVLKYLLGKEANFRRLFAGTVDLFFSFSRPFFFTQSATSAVY